MVKAVHMLRKELRRYPKFSYPADIDALLKQEIKAKAEEQATWLSVEGVTNIYRASCQRLVDFWLLMFKEISVQSFGDH